MSSTTTAGMCVTPCVCGHPSIVIVDYATFSMYRFRHHTCHKGGPMSDFNSSLIEQIRAGGGHLSDGPFAGRQVLILTTTGAQSKEKREAPLVYSRDGDDIVIIASMGGAPRHPSWYHNIVANPRVTIEVDGAKFEAERPDHRGRRAPSSLRPARRAPRQLHRVRGEDGRSGDPGDRPPARGGIGRRLTLRSADGRRRGAGPHGRPRPSSPTSRSMHAANRAAWDEAAERYEGWFDEAVALIRSGGTNLFGVETQLIGDLHGRCRRAIHLQCAGGRDTLSLWNQGADEVVGVDFSPKMLELAQRLTEATGAPARWILADVLDTPARARRHRGPRLHRPRLASSGSRTWMPGRPSSPDSSPRPVASSCSRDTPPNGCSTPTRTAAGSPPTTTTSVVPRRRRAGRPSTSTGCRSRRRTRAGSSRGHGRSARSITALLGADLRLEAVAEHPIDWWGGHGDVREDERGRIPLSFSVVGRRGP